MEETTTTTAYGYGNHQEFTTGEYIGVMIVLIPFFVILLGCMIRICIFAIPGLDDFLGFYFEDFFEKLKHKVKIKREIKRKEWEIKKQKQEYNLKIDDKIKQQVKEEFEEFFTQLEKTELTREFLKEQVDKLKKTKL